MYDQTNNHQDYSRKPLFRGLIAGVLILLLLIPASFVNNLVKEREERQKEVVSEVSNKWARAQVFTSPYLVIPYYGKDSSHTIHQLILLPAQLNVSGKILPATRTRSIYHVLLYNSDLLASGSFNIRLPVNIAAGDVHWNEAKICMGINDFRGLQEEVNLNFNNRAYLLQPGLPYGGIDAQGLSSVVDVNEILASGKLSFSLALKLKGSEKLSFVPLAANSVFNIRSTWPNPSFNGNTLPATHQVTGNGFDAQWKFIGANLPFTTSSSDMSLNKSEVSFGINMLQPADQYAKTSRCTK
ncbi:MAG: creD, partial [Chitinophagaceae bacterium]|nr:creD [Chitinophagaceae bacterium]